MFEYLNNFWIILICIVLLYIIINKIIHLNSPFDENTFITKYKNQKKLQEKFTLPNLYKSIPSMFECYLGL